MEVSVAAKSKQKWAVTQSHINCQPDPERFAAVASEKKRKRKMRFGEFWQHPLFIILNKNRHFGVKSYRF